MSDDDYPREYPFGQTEYKNYDPDQVNTVDDAIELLLFFADENEAAGNPEASGAFRDAAGMLEDSLVVFEREE